MSLRDTLHEAATRCEYKRNLRGFTSAKCPAACNHGEATPGRSERDSHGSYYVPGTPCYTCQGSGYVEVSCAPAVEAAAIRTEIDRLKARLKELRQPLTKRAKEKP
jgi:hypothetical protein